MDFKVNWIPTEIEFKGEGVYCEDEYDLEYLLPPSTKNKNDNNKPNLQQIIDSNLGLNTDTDFLVIADELTLTFSGKSKKLWKRTNNLSIPITKRKGCLVIENVLVH